MGAGGGGEQISNLLLGVKQYSEYKKKSDLSYSN